MTGCERLRSMIGEGEVPFKKYLFKIYTYLKTREDMYEKYLNPEKSMNQMYEYIKGQAKKQAKNGVAILEDSVVYGLAIHYFDESNKDLGIKNEEIKEKKAEGKVTTIEESNGESSPKKEEREQISLFDV